MKKGSTGATIYGALTSMRFAIIALIVLGSLSIAAVLFQDAHPTNFSGWEEHYKTHLAPWKYALYSGLQLFTPYKSWWFVSLLVLLSVSVFLCSIRNAAGMFRLAFARSDFRSKEQISRFKNTAAFVLPEGTAVDALRTVLRRKAFRSAVKEESGEICLYARQSGLSRIGPFLSHAGLILLFVGGLAVALLGKTQMLWGDPGSTISAPFADHKVRVDDFKIYYNDKGQVKDYVSWLTVLDEQDAPVVEKRIEVNQPLRYHGVSYYQSSYQVHPRRFSHAALEVTTPNKAVPDTVHVHLGEKTPVAGTGLSVMVADFAADFKLAKEGVVSASGELRNPAMLVQIWEKDKEIAHQWLFANFPSFHSSGDSTMHANLLGFEPLYYTGLQASTNPASPFIWTGFGLMSLGICFVFFLNHKQIWAAVKREAGKKDSVVVAGASHKFKDQFSREFDVIVQKTKASGTAAGKMKIGAAERAVVLGR